MWNLGNQQRPVLFVVVCLVAARLRGDQYVVSGVSEAAVTGWLVAGVLLVLLIGGAIALMRLKQQLKQETEAHHQAARMLRTVLDSIPIRVYWKDRESTYLGCNRAFARDAGLESPDEIIGLHDRELPWHRQEVEQYLAVDREILDAGKEILEFEEPMTGLDGTTHYIRTSKFPLRDDNGEIIGVLGIYQDTTAEKQAEEERIELIRRMQRSQKYESLTTLAGGVAHHFNNLLQVILGNAALAMASPDEDIMTYLVRIREATERASQLSRQLAATAGGSVVNRQPIELGELLTELTPLLQTTVAKDVRLECHLPDNRLIVNADHGQLRQLLVNLVRNASEAIAESDKERGVVSVLSGSREFSREELASPWVLDEPPAGIYGFIEVRDTGVGMSEKTLERLTDPFFTTKLPGRGLGLAAVLGIVRSHHGTIQATSKPGSGSTLRVILPLAKSPLGVSTEPPPRQADKVSGTALIIDDEVTLLELGTAVLQRLGMSALTAKDGPSGLSLLRRNPDRIDCVILDLVMPEMDGHEVFHRIREMRSDLPVIIATGYQADDAARAFEDDDIVGILRKPFSLQEFESLLTQALAGNSGS